MEFLASDEALDLPDRIEEVNAKRLDAQINEKTFIAVLFRKNGLLSGHTYNGNSWNLVQVNLIKNL